MLRWREWNSLKAIYLGDCRGAAEIDGGKRKEEIGRDTKGRRKNAFVLVSHPQTQKSDHDATRLFVMNSNVAPKFL